MKKLILFLALFSHSLYASIVIGSPNVEINSEGLYLVQIKISSTTNLAEDDISITNFKSNDDLSDFNFEFKIFENLQELRMMGKIAAGTPIAAIEYEKNKISVPNHMVGSGEHYALEIEGDSMIGAGILDGDTAIIKKADDAYSGEIIVALIDGEEATLKRLRKKGDTIALEPANSAYETKIYGPDRVQVQGTLVGILRSY